VASVGVPKAGETPTKVVIIVANDLAGLTDNAWSVLQQGDAGSLAGFGCFGTSLAQQSCAETAVR
jgi:hypothetical protein